MASQGRSYSIISVDRCTHWRILPVLAAHVAFSAHMAVVTWVIL